MNWHQLAIVSLCCCVCTAFGMVIGLSLGFQLGTKRTIILFTRHFPTVVTMNELVKQLFRIANKLTNEKQPPAPPS